MIQTSFKRIETKYIIREEIFPSLLKDLSHYMREDEYPTSTISNIYFDTPDFQVIKDALAKKHHREKIRMRSYLAHPTADSQAFLEVKQKDAYGVGHKFRLVATPERIEQLISEGISDAHLTDQHFLEEIHTLRERYKNLSPRIYIYYDRYSLKQKKGLEDKVRITFDHNLKYRDTKVCLTSGTEGEALLAPGEMVMEIKAAAEKPAWLQEILDRYGLVRMKFSKYTAAYHHSQDLPYRPRIASQTESVGA